MTSQQELLDFISNRRNVGEGKEEFFVHVVWLIGECPSPLADARCTPEMIDQYHEVSDVIVEVSDVIVKVVTS